MIKLCLNLNSNFANYNYEDLPKYIHEPEIQVKNYQDP